jgi:hypothetical protein
VGFWQYRAKICTVSIIPQTEVFVKPFFKPVCKFASLRFVACKGSPQLFRKVHFQHFSQKVHTTFMQNAENALFSKKLLTNALK